MAITEEGVIVNRTRSNHHQLPSYRCLASQSVDITKSKLKRRTQKSIMTVDANHNTSRTATASSSSSAVPSLVSYRGFFKVFVNAKGAKEILAVSFLMAFGIGCVIGVIPDTTADRYARIHHGYTGNHHCGDLDVKPAACQAGSDDAQAAAAWGSVGQTILALIFNPVFGHLADICGRRYIMICSILLSCIPAIVLLLMQVSPMISPTWYFMTYCLIGILNFLGIAIAALSDNVPEEYRAPTYGLLLCVFYGALATGPTFSLVLGHLCSTIVSLGLIVVSLLTAIFFLPETLPQEIRLENIAKQRQSQQRQQQQQELLQNDSAGSTYHTLLLAPLCRLIRRPFQDIAILNRSWTMRLVTAASFLDAMVFAGDSTLFIYYVEDRLDMRDDDIARIFIVVGIVGCLLQGGALQPLIQMLGEKKLLLCAFAAAATHNFLFGAATAKLTIYMGVILGQVGKLNFAVLASFASKGVSAHEQGLVQGALAATNSIGSGMGPLSMQFVYNHTKNNQHFGPGFMFVYVGLMDMIGIMLVALIPSPPRHAGSSSNGTNATNPESTTTANVINETCINDGVSDLEEPLLESSH